MWDNKNDKAAENHIPFSEIQLFTDADLTVPFNSQANTNEKVEWLLWLYPSKKTKKVHPDEWKKIADYPHIARKIELLSSSPYELVLYLQDLINPDYNPERRQLNVDMWKPKERIWFPISMLMELHIVLEDAILKKEKADSLKWIIKKEDPWSSNNNKVR